MRRLLSQSRSSRLSTVLDQSEKRQSQTPILQPDEASSIDGGDATPTTAPSVSAPLAAPNLKVKRVDHYWSNWSKGWKYRNTGSNVVAEAANAIGNGTENDPWQNFCFVVVRKFPGPREGNEKDITFQIVVKSTYLLKACKDVIGQVPGISWTAEPLELDPQLLITFLPQFEEYEKTLSAKAKATTEDQHVLNTVRVLLDYLRKDYRTTLSKIASLTAHGEITFDLLYSILIPRSILVTECPSTGEPRALQLLSAQKLKMGNTAVYSLLCESVDSLEEGAHPGRTSENTMSAVNTQIGRLQAAMRMRRTNGGTNGAVPAQALSGRTFGRVQSKIFLGSFSGTVKISSLEAYPIAYHPQSEALRAALLERGRKWASLKGIHHMHYEGTAGFAVSDAGCKKIIKYNVNSRIMIDRGNFIRLNPNYSIPKPSNTQQDQYAIVPPMPGQPPIMPNPHDANIPTLEVRAKHAEETPLDDSELLLASPVLYGFSLSDKIWLEFNVEYIKPVSWNEEAFEGLVLAADRKSLLRSLVDAHNASLGFDDFVQGKGQGLIINLFGPPGVGKTLSAEATSEHTHRPLYVVGGGDLGTKASELDLQLERVFDIATSWKAIVLIDEADVFLERRSLHDLERNAMVAVFLRHVEYYRGILFLTTNRIKAFDDAFLSRIHVALNFGELSPAAKAQVWRAFLRKAGSNALAADDALVEKLAARDVNGRQIKNACRTAQSLAFSREEELGFVHLAETLDAMEVFTAEFAALQRE